MFKNELDGVRYAENTCLGGLLEAIWGPSGRSFGSLRRLLETSWEAFGTLWGASRPLLRSPGGPFWRSRGLPKASLGTPKSTIAQFCPIFSVI